MVLQIKFLVVFLEFETSASPKAPPWAFELFKIGLVKFSLSHPHRLSLGISIKIVYFPFPPSPACYPPPQLPYGTKRLLRGR